MVDTVEVNKYDCVKYEIIDKKNNLELMENEITVCENAINDLKCQIADLDYNIAVKHNELNDRLNCLEQSKMINCYGQYIQDVTKRWIGHLKESFGNHNDYLEHLALGKDELSNLAEQFIEIKNEILMNKNLKPGWSRDSVKRYAENLITSVENDAKNDLRFERDELVILQRRIESEAELLKYSVNEKQLEPPVFENIKVTLLEKLNLDDYGRKAIKRHFVGTNDEHKKRARKGEYVSVEFQKAVPTNSYRHQQQQYPSQPKPQSQEICPTNTSQTFGYNEKTDEQPVKASAHRLNLGESQERNEEPSTSQPIRNHVKFEEPPRVNQYMNSRSFNDSFEQQDMDSRKRKNQNELPSSLDKVVDLIEDSPDYVIDEDNTNEAKRAKYDSDKELDLEFGSNYCEPDFLQYPPNTQGDTQASDCLFSFTQDFNLDFFGTTKNDVTEKEPSIKGVLH